MNFATSDTRHIIKIAKRLLNEIYKAGYRYQKCGVQLGHIQLAMTPNQTDLFDLTSESNNIKSQKLMAAIDNINKRFPKGITVSATGFKNSWQYQISIYRNAIPRAGVNWLW